MQIYYVNKDYPKLLDAIGEYILSNNLDATCLDNFIAVTTTLKEETLVSEVIGTFSENQEKILKATDPDVEVTNTDIRSLLISKCPELEEGLNEETLIVDKRKESKSENAPHVSRRDYERFKFIANTSESYNENLDPTLNSNRY